MIIEPASRISNIKLVWMSPDMYCKKWMTDVDLSHLLLDECAMYGDVKWPWKVKMQIEAFYWV